MPESRRPDRSAPLAGPWHSRRSNTPIAPTRAAAHRLRPKNLSANARSGGRGLPRSTRAGRYSLCELVHPQCPREPRWWDPSTKVAYDQALFNEFVSLRFLEAHAHVAIVGPVGAGKTFIAHALGHVACDRGHSVLVVRADRMLKTLRHARLDNSFDTELRKLIVVDLLIIDDFGLDAMDAQESRDVREILTERHRSGSVIITSNRGPDEWLPTFADPVRAQAAIDRFTSNAYDLVIDGESYRARLKPNVGQAPAKPPAPRPGQRRRARRH